MILKPFNFSKLFSILKETSSLLANESDINKKKFLLLLKGKLNNMSNGRRFQKVLLEKSAINITTAKKVKETKSVPITGD